MACHAWGDPSATLLVAVHGLTRRGSDFTLLASQMSEEGYYVVCPDIVGRGESDHLANPARYAVPQYVEDMKCLVEHLGATSVQWLGTSMGGLIGMLYASMPGNPIKRMIINDIGPRIEREALERLGTYVGKAMEFDTEAEGLVYMQEICAKIGRHTVEEWNAINGPMLKQQQGDNGKWGLHYDLRIGEAFATFDPQSADAGEKVMWEWYRACTVPVLVVRGGASDLLSAATVEQMKRENPMADSIELPAVGHAPTFWTSEQINIAKDFFRP